MQSILRSQWGSLAGGRPPWGKVTRVLLTWRKLQQLLWVNVDLCQLYHWCKFALSQAGRSGPRKGIGHGSLWHCRSGHLPGPIHPPRPIATLPPPLHCPVLGLSGPAGVALHAGVSGKAWAFLSVRQTGASPPSALWYFRDACQRRNRLELSHKSPKTCLSLTGQPLLSPSSRPAIKHQQEPK